MQDPVKALAQSPFKPLVVWQLNALVQGLMLSKQLLETWLAFVPATMTAAPTLVPLRTNKTDCVGPADVAAFRKD